MAVFINGLPLDCNILIIVFFLSSVLAQNASLVELIYT